MSPFFTELLGTLGLAILYDWNENMEAKGALILSEQALTTTKAQLLSLKV